MGKSRNGSGFPKTGFPFFFCPCIWYSSCSCFLAGIRRTRGESFWSWHMDMPLQWSKTQAAVVWLVCVGTTWFGMVLFPLVWMVSWYPAITALKFHQPTGNAFYAPNTQAPLPSSNWLGSQAPNWWDPSHMIVVAAGTRITPGYFPCSCAGKAFTALQFCPWSHSSSSSLDILG